MFSYDRIVKNRYIIYLKYIRKGETMKIAIVGSRSLTMDNFDDFLPAEAIELLCGGARGIDTCVREYAKRKGLVLTEFFPNYARFGRAAPLKRNLEMIERADEVVAFWDGKSRGTAFVIDACKKSGKPITVHILE